LARNADEMQTGDEVVVRATSRGVRRKQAPHCRANPFGTGLGRGVLWRSACQIVLTIACRLASRHHPGKRPVRAGVGFVRVPYDPATVDSAARAARSEQDSSKSRSQPCECAPRARSRHSRSVADRAAIRDIILVVARDHSGMPACRSIAIDCARASSARAARRSAVRTPARRAPCAARPSRTCRALRRSRR